MLKLCQRIPYNIKFLLPVTTLSWNHTSLNRYNRPQQGPFTCFSRAAIVYNVWMMSHTHNMRVLNWYDRCQFKLFELYYNSDNITNVINIHIDMDSSPLCQLIYFIKVVYEVFKLSWSHLMFKEITFSTLVFICLCELTEFWFKFFVDEFSIFQNSFICLAFRTYFIHIIGPVDR